MTSKNLHHRTVLWLAVSLAAVLLAACGGGSPTPTPTLEGIDPFPPCTPADLIAPENLGPGSGDIVLELSPLFVWHYGSCEPEGYTVEVTTYGGYAYGTTQTHTSSDGLLTNWTFDTPLEPATQYEWHVAAIIGGSTGPFSSSTSFWTGPICETASMQTPVQGTPANNSEVSDPFQPMGWGFLNDCIPNWVNLELNEYPDFSGPNLVATGAATTPHIGQIPADALADCTQYYWRVQGENPDGATAWSPTWTFRTNFSGACAPPPTCDTAALLAPVPGEPIAGQLVDDLMPTFNWFYGDSCQPEGYRIEVSTYGGYDYGTTYSGGTGNPNTVWSLADMLEPATQYEWRVAAINGTTLGPYSVSVPFWTGPQCATASLAAPLQNTPADMSVVDNEYPPLGWSYPGGCLPEYTLLELDVDPSFAGPNLVDGFGGPRIGQIPLAALNDCTTYYWRVRSENGDGAGPFSPTWSFYTDFAGGCSAPAGFSSAAPVALALRDLNCRAGDGQAFNETGFFGKGEQAEIVGVNGSHSWLLVPKALGGGNCWVSTAYVDLGNADLNKVQVIASPPTPVPTATPKPELPLSNKFAVTDVSVSVDKDNYRGKCPVRFTFTALITANGPGTVQYQWLRSDQAQSQPQSVEFQAAGTKQVQSTWDLSGSFQGLWKQVQILSPNGMLSNQASFSVTCP